MFPTSSCTAHPRSILAIIPMPVFPPLYRDVTSCRKRTPACWRLLALKNMLDPPITTPRQTDTGAEPVTGIHPEPYNLDPTGAEGRLCMAGTAG